MVNARKTLGTEELRAERRAFRPGVMSVEKMGGAPSVMQLSRMDGWPCCMEERIGSRVGLVSSANLLA